MNPRPIDGGPAGEDAGEVSGENDSVGHDARRRAALAGHRGDTATARRLLSSDDAVVRRLALGALHRAGGADDGALCAALADPDAGVRVRALELAVERRGLSLVALLGDPDPLVTQTTAWALGERADTDPLVIDALSSVAANHRDPLCREAAVAALGAIGDERGLPAILSATTDKPAVRRRAVIALAPYDSPVVDAALTRALTDRDRQVRQAAEDLQSDV